MPKCSSEKRKESNREDGDKIELHRKIRKNKPKEYIRI